MDDKRGRFEAQVLPYLDAAYRFARWLSPSPSDADDIVQEAFLRAFRGFEGLRGTDVKSWLLTIVRNCHLSALKRPDRRAFVPLPEDHEAPFDGAQLHGVTEPAPDPESASIQRDDARLLDRLMSSLPDEHREMLILREMEEMSYREIAAVTNVPIGTVMSRLARARAALKAKWQDTHGEPRAMR